MEALLHYHITRTALCECYEGYQAKTLCMTDDSFEIELYDQEKSLLLVRSHVTRSLGRVFVGKALDFFI